MELALSDLRLAEVVGEFSVSCKVLFLKRKAEHEKFHAFASKRFSVNISVGWGLV